MLCVYECILQKWYLFLIGILSLLLTLKKRVHFISVGVYFTFLGKLACDHGKSTASFECRWW